MDNCVLCKEDAPSLDEKIEDLVMDMIKRNNPNWVESDGACKRCVVYYENLSKIVEVEEK